MVIVRMCTCVCVYVCMCMLYIFSLLSFFFQSNIETLLLITQRIVVFTVQSFTFRNTRNLKYDKILFSLLRITQRMKRVLISFFFFLKFHSKVTSTLNSIVVRDNADISSFIFFFYFFLFFLSVKKCIRRLLHAAILILA